MSKEIKWKVDGYWAIPMSLGRNGYIQTHGLQVQSAPAWDEVEIYPITSKGHKGRCKIKFPKEAIPELIKALQEIQ